MHGCGLLKASRQPGYFLVCRIRSGLDTAAGLRTNWSEHRLFSTLSTRVRLGNGEGVKGRRV